MISRQRASNLPEGMMGIIEARSVYPQYCCFQQRQPNVWQLQDRQA
jgi:hypothetical protein